MIVSEEIQLNILFLTSFHQTVNLTILHLQYYVVSFLYGYYFEAE